MNRYDGRGRDAAGAGNTVCVFCASSDHLDVVYIEVARTLGAAMAARGLRLVYGGGNNGLMGVLAETLHDRGGHVTGVIPQSLKDHGWAYAGADELIVTENLRDRKALMEERADAFLCLPGGFGTLEEILEIITLKQLGMLDKPIVLLNVNGYFEGLLTQLERSLSERFLHENDRGLFTVADDVTAALDYMEDALAGGAGD